MMSDKFRRKYEGKLEVKYFIFLLFLLGFSLFSNYYKPASKNYSIFTRNWGFDLLSFYTFPVQILLILFSLVIIVPRTNGYLANFLYKIAIQLRNLRFVKHILFIAIAVASVFVFYELRVKYFFLGDFTLRLEQIMRRDFISTEYLTMRILYWFGSLGFEYGYSPKTMFVFYSCIAGGFYVFFCLHIADLLGETGFQKLFFFFALVGTSMILVFCGYIEVYSTPIVLLTMYIYFGLRYLKFKRHFALILISLILAVASHLLNLALVPSVFTLWYFNHRSKLKVISSASNKTIASFIGVLVLVAIFLAFNVRNNFVLPITPPKNSIGYMKFFSIEHFWEIVNGQILSCGVSFVLLFVMLFVIIKKKIVIQSLHYFIISIAGCFLLIVILANLQRGSGDWDIMAFTAIPLNILTLFGINVVYKGNGKLVTYLQTCVIVLNLLHTGVWIHINHTDKSIGKIEAMLINDPGTYYARFPAILQLGDIYKANKLFSKSDEFYLKACESATARDVRPCEFYGQGLLDRNKISEARDFYERLLPRLKVVPQAYIFLLQYYERQRNRQKYDYYLEELFDSFMLDPNYFLSKSEPKLYLALFERLYKLELPKNNGKRLQEINFTIGKLKTIKPIR